jgi:chromosomal replication initiation ATPase DnaA
MTKGTFTTWLADTRAAGIDGNTLIVIVPSIQAHAWLEERLCAVITRTVHNVAQHLENVRFVLANEHDPQEPHP